MCRCCISRRGKDIVEDDSVWTGEDWIALGVNEEMGGSVEEVVVAVAETRVVIEEVGRVKVDDVEDTGVV